MVRQTGTNKAAAACGNTLKGQETLREDAVVETCAGQTEHEDAAAARIPGGL